MTQRQLENRVKFWQKKLGSLGLGHWQFTIEIVDEPEGRPGSLAAISHSPYYDCATIQFRRDHLDTATQYQIDRSIVHELMHAVHRDYDDAIHSVCDRLPADMVEAWHHRLDHEEEGVVDRCARAMVDLVHL